MVADAIDAPQGKVVEGNIPADLSGFDIGPKTRELISLAVAVTVRCDGCIAVHAEAAARQGASREEIAEALGVATAVNAGAALVYSTRVLDAYEQVTAA